MTVLSQSEDLVHTRGATTGFLWLEITGKCQLECVGCYASSGPDGTHGDMSAADWVRVIDQFSEMPGADQKMVQFIGGEPTLNPLLPELVRHALSHGLLVEIFSNLVAVPASVWDVLRLPGVSLATSYYSGIPEQHEAIVQRRGSHKHTTSNIIKAMGFGIPLRVGLIQVQADQDVDGARQILAAAGVDERNIGFDSLREVGRGLRSEDEASMDALCGHCASGRAAILPDGNVMPCVFSRWLSVGNVLESSLADVLGGSLLATTRATLADHFAATYGHTMCNPSACKPNACNPGLCGPDNTDCEPKRPCEPRRP